MKKFIAVILSVITVLSLAAVPSAAQGKYIYGDVNDDGRVTSLDALIMMQYSVKLTELDRTEKILADVTGDGAINSSDALAALMYATGMIEVFTKSYENSLKYKYVDKTLSGAAYTVGFSTEMDGEKVDMLLTTDGKKKTASMTMKLDLTDITDGDLDSESLAQLEIFKAFFGSTFDFEIRYFTDTDGKTYLIIPFLKSYCRLDEDASADYLFEIADFMFREEMLFVGTSSEKSGSITYTCEAFKSDSNDEVRYLFNGNSLKIIELPADDGVEVYTVNKLASTAESAMLSIPAGYREDNSIMDFGG